MVHVLSDFLSLSLFFWCLFDLVSSLNVDDLRMNAAFSPQVGEHDYSESPANGPLSRSKLSLRISLSYFDKE